MEQDRLAKATPRWLHPLPKIHRVVPQSPWNPYWPCLILHIELQPDCTWREVYEETGHCSPNWDPCPEDPETKEPKPCKACK